MKTLVVVTHPDLSASRVNKRWTEELKKYPEKYTIHALYDLYPDGVFDIKKEQALAIAHDKIIFQFPYYWFNCPPLLKKWLDDVLTDGWAYGRNSGYQLGGKKVALAISAGVREELYSATGRYKYTMQQLTSPFQITFEYIRADYRPFFAFYGAEHNPPDDAIDGSATEYVKFIDAL